MAIKKQEFYEGAALHALARTGFITSIEYESPFFRLNRSCVVHLKYCTRSRSPWGFTFTRDEQSLLRMKAEQSRTVIGLICGADGVASLSYEHFSAVAAPRTASLHIACYRQHGKHYQVSGPDGRMLGKIAPSSWLKILTEGTKDDESP